MKILSFKYYTDLQKWTDAMVVKVETPNYLCQLYSIHSRGFIGLNSLAPSRSNASYTAFQHFVAYENAYENGHLTK